MYTYRKLQEKACYKLNGEARWYDSYGTSGKEGFINKSAPEVIFYCDGGL